MTDTKTTTPPAAFVPNCADTTRANIAATFAPRDLDAQREITQLTVALEQVTRERDEAREEVAGLKRSIEIFIAASDRIRENRDATRQALKMVFDLLEDHLPEWYLVKHHNIIGPFFHGDPDA